MKHCNNKNERQWIRDPKHWIKWEERVLNTVGRARGEWKSWKMWRTRISSFCCCCCGHPLLGVRTGVKYKKRKRGWRKKRSCWQFTINGNVKLQAKETTVKCKMTRYKPSSWKKKLKNTHIQQDEVCIE